MAFQEYLRTLGDLAREAHGAGWISEMPSQRDSVHVAVIGEIKRGKSTFLNALMGEKVFPSRSSVCTTAVTFLEDGPPSIKAVYRSELNRPAETRLVGEGENIFDCLQEMVAKPNLLGKKGNPHARDLDAVVVSYPNRFATDGVRLVDTPGVNDPESWREEITFQFLPQVDAALMLLDPQQPLSKSEMDFIKNRATKAVKDQLILVLSRCDEVKPEDLEKSVARIRREMEPLLPKVRLFTVASKPALEAKKSGEPIPESWQEFERALDQFLHAGKAGALLISRAKGIHEEVAARFHLTETHLESLSRIGFEEKAQLEREEHELMRIRTGVENLHHRSQGLLAVYREKLLNNLEQFLVSQRNLLRKTTNDDLQAFVSRYMRDLQENRLIWIKDVAFEFETLLQKEVMVVVGKECNVRAFHIPEMRGLQAAPSFSTPKQKQEDDGIPGYLGMIVGVLFGSPIVGAGLAFLANFMFGSDDGGESDAAYEAYREECGEFLNQCKNSVQIDVDNLLERMNDVWIPQFFSPLQIGIDRQSSRVSETQADLNKSDQERDQKRQVLTANVQALDVMLKRISSFLNELQAAGSTEKSITN